MRGGRDDYDDEGDNMDKSDTISTASWRPRTATELERFDLGTNDIDGYEGDDGDDVDADAEEEPSQGDNGLTQTLENWGYSTREREDWTLYLRHVKYDNGEANAMASKVSEARTVLW